MTNHRWKILLTLLAALSLLAGACSSDGDGDAADPETGADGASGGAEGSTEAGGVTREPTDGEQVACPGPDGTVSLFAPYEAGLPAGANWRAGIEHAVTDINGEGGILGCTIAVEYVDTGVDAGAAAQVLAGGIAADPYAILGPVGSGSVLAGMVEAQRAEIPQFVGADATAITDRAENGDNDYVFRVAQGPESAAAKLVDVMLGAGVVTIDHVVGSDDVAAEADRLAMDDAGIDIGEEVRIEAGQTDVADAVATLVGSEADAVFVSLSDAEAVAFLNEAKNQGLAKPIYGGGVLGSPSVLGRIQPGAADGVVLHADLDAAAAPFTDWLAAHQAAHPGITGIDGDNLQGYLAVHYLKEMTERIGAFDRVAVAQGLHCATITTGEEPGVLVDVSFDADGAPDRESSIVQITGGAAQIVSTAPPLGNLADRGC